MDPLYKTRYLNHGDGLDLDRTQSARWRCDVENDIAALDQMQNAYKAALNEWIDAIKIEEALASVNHSVADADQWEAAHFREEEIRGKVKAAKKRYEDALRKKFFGF
jgi:hypothetical protein